MAVSSDPLTCKKSFLEENLLFSEIELTDEAKSIGKLREFNLLENEVWLLQCPKGMDVTELENQKLKIPGRTHINSSEAVSMEFSKGKEQRAFAYLGRKRRYDIRLVPVSGTIIVRDRLKAATTISEERAEECCPSAKKVPMPASIRVRHHLLGAQYKDKLELDKTIVERLQKADKQSAQILKESLNQRNVTKTLDAFKKTNGKEGNLIPPIGNDSADDDVEFVSEEKLKKNKNKHGLSKSNGELHSSSDTSKSKNKKSKISRVNEEFISQDLEWLKNI